MFDINNRDDDTIRKLKLALTSHGFFTITDHGIADEVLEKSYKVSQEFFSLPDEVKSNYAHPEKAGARGYTPYGKETAVGETTPDLKEFWHHGPTVDESFDSRISKNILVSEVPDFNNQFDQIFEDAKSIGFLKTKKGEIKSLGKSKFYSTNNKVNGIAPQIILDEENNLRFCVRFSCRENVNLAKELCSLLENIIKHKVPKTYQRARDFSPEYAKSIYAFIWEFESEKFIEIAKKPSVSVGVLKESSNFLVEVRIMEPVFKR